MKTPLILGAAVAACALAPAAKDAVIMTVNGEAVPQSEFEYLYNKNSEQQQSPQPIDEYLEMFKLYKLKVAEARAQHLDTLAQFKREMAEYRHDLAAPYLTDSTYINTLFQETLNRLDQEAEAQHIMWFKTRDGKKNAALRAQADSVLKVLRAGGDFEELAKKFSDDEPSAVKGGYMGYIPAMRLPYAFETAAYTLGDGEISDVVVTPMGYHILKGGKKRKSDGQVSASHILFGKDRLAQRGSDPKAAADSLYAILVEHPNTFHANAYAYSDDPGSQQKGGRLGWFSRGQMVAEFDSVAFALADGEISKPVQTQFGWHIIKREDHRAHAPENDIKTQFLRMISDGQDPRKGMIRDEESARLAKKHNGTFNKALLDRLSKEVNTGIDSTFYQRWSTAPLAGEVIYSVDGTPTTMGELIATLPLMPISADAPVYIDRISKDRYNEALRTAEETLVMEQNPDYANLYKEYVDGSLLYEVSLRSVWDKAAKDEAGLQKFFDANRKKYDFNDTKVKGYLVQVSNDSVMGAVKARAAELEEDKLTSTLRKEFQGSLLIRKVLESKGGNAMVDQIMFDGPEAKSSDARYPVFFMLNPRMITAPEELADVKGLVVADYQSKLQKDWEESLKSKYPVKVDKEVLAKVKEKYSKNKK